MSRPGRTKYLLLAALVAVGLAGGVYLARSRPRPAPEPVQPLATALRVALSSLDAKDAGEGPDLAADGSRVYLAWASKTGPAERTVFVCRADGDARGEPTAVGKGGVYRTPGSKGKHGHERRAMPRVVCEGGRVHLAWSDAAADGSGVRLVLATSGDGKAFAPPVPVASEGKANATFAALTAGGGALACCWLDDRAGKQQTYAATRPAGEGRFSPERLAYAGQEGKGVCPCCPTAALLGPDGTLFVAFRNVHDGHRDIAVSVLRPGASSFDGPFPVVRRAWKFDGCPHDGPSLALAGGLLHVVWMDARTGTPRCYHGWARPEDMTFASRELHAAGAGAQNNPRLSADANGTLHAVWEEGQGGAGRVVLYAKREPGQEGFGPPAAVAPREGAFQTRPAVVKAATGGVYVAFNEADEAGKAVVVARVR